MATKVLIIDDDNLVCESLIKVLTRFGYETEYCLVAEDAHHKISSFQPEIVLLDIYLTTRDGIDLLKEIHAEKPEISCIMITGYSDVKLAVLAMKAGAIDFLLKPLDLDQLKMVLKKCENQLSLQREVKQLRSIVSGEALSKDHFGGSKTMTNALNVIEKLARSDDTTILLEGESGTGKEVVARFVHQNSPRVNSVFIAVNCAAIPKELAESELFGHEKGAFTGAGPKTKLGKFELAGGGTILLDEIGELNLDLQVKLLRVLQEKKFYRLGGEKEISVNVRVIAATNRNLEEEVNKGNFREDLFYRLNVARVQIPPLRERREDIPLFVHSFVQEFAVKFSSPVTRIEESVISFLTNQYWKGNVRELRNAIERAILMMEGNELKEKHFAFLRTGKQEEKHESGKFILRVPKEGIAIDTVLRTLILQTLEITKGNQVRAAKVLGLSRSKLRYRMEQLGIEVTKKIE